ncbi:SDR family oxidoreductase [Roseomonas alkaliterrae]|uniref:Gluconate 5-dehydrogenase n=1 Tax=Neoroseomonas alkaliterrae TaxID=1452450 RepID=A0A840XRY5_9PROT|nr:SDR family oxidoreductase [Neoroseomonas alkaliterrae]MBB5689710.1 gluconate 5-dehydrogenase [Neoroseomonas alkaliterrae]MBR0676534.1 SDR family oxidoreductase [Neoroseomonas alkaliterrae]
MSRALFDLSGTLALVTGSSQGIGLALARGLAEAGAKVVLNGRDAAKLEAARAHVPGAVTAAFDVTDHAAVEAGIAAIEAAHGPLHILVANAGINLRAPSTEMPPETWRRVMEVNLDGVWYCCQAAGKRMVHRGRGKIITVCSVQSELGRPTIAPYAASKGALRMLTRTLCAEWARHGVNVNGLAPGYYDTELTSALVQDPAFTEWLCKRVPAGRWGRVEELIGAAVFLAAPASDFVHGQLIFVDGGMTAVV